MPELFGTDGVRGEANVLLTPDLALALGRAAGTAFQARGRTVVIGRDTRLSGPMLEAALVAGLCSAGAEARLAGILPTPAIAWLTAAGEAAAGAMISASHNPVQDNGIKFFSPGGMKADVQLEEEMESLLSEPPEDLPGGAGVGGVEVIEDAEELYIGHLLDVSAPLAGLRIVLDCAFGAAWSVGPEVFRRAGADVVSINDEPDGSRINVDSGSTSLTSLSRAVVAAGADLGIAFDGDADRALAVDEQGQPIGGDQILAMCALDLKGAGRLPNHTLVATVMSNMGFRRFMEAQGISVVVVPVGDRHVSAAMVAEGAALGGEQSGHVVFREHTATGDGVLTGLKIAGAAAASEHAVSKLAHLFDPWPQELINVRVPAQHLAEAKGVWEEVKSAEERLGDRGRVLLRPSGTEPLVRVMVESESPEMAQSLARHLADVVQRELG